MSPRHVVVVPSSPALLLIGPFLFLWVGPTFSVAAAPVAYILLVGIWANGLALLPYSSLQGRKRPDLVLKAHAAELLPYMGLLYLGMTLLGLPGVALVWSLRAIVDGVVLSALSERSLGAVRSLWFPFALVVAAAVTALSLPMDSWLRWALLLALLGVAAAFGVRNAPASLRDLVAGALRRVIPRRFVQ